MRNKEWFCEKYLQGVVISVCFVCCLLLNVSRPAPARALETVRLQLAWKHQFQFGGYYAALHRGFYRDAGLDVRIKEGGEGRFAREEVLEGRARYGVAGSELILHRQDGDPFVVLAPVFQHSPSVLLARKDSGITHLQDLIGKRVMLLKGKKDADILAAFLNEGISLDSFQRLDQTFNIDDLIGGRTDAVSAYSTNEPWYLEQQGIEPQILSPRTYGVDFYSDCLFTTEDEVHTHPQRARSFLKASLSGWEYAMNHPEEIIDLLISDYNVNKSRAHLRYEAREIRKIMLPDLVEIGHMNPGRWRHIARNYAKLGLIERDFSLEGFLYKPDAVPDYTLLKWGAGILAAVLLLAAGGAFILFAYNRKLAEEIRERKRAETALLESEKRFREILEDVSNIAVQGYDEQRRVMFWNQASENLYGYRKQEAVGRKLEDLIIPPEMKEDVIRLHRRWLEYGEKIPAAELSLIHKNGGRVPVFSSHVLHETVSGREMFCIDVDLRSFKQAEKEKEQAQKEAAEHEKYSLVGQIAGKMAHDFNNILGSVMGNAELAALDCPHEPTARTLKLIVEQVLRGRNLTRNLVAFAKDQEPRQEYFPIDEKLELVLKLLHKDLQKMNIVRELDPDVPDLLADAGMIEHALVNLIQNSIHATGKTPDAAIFLRTSTDNGHIRIEVEDNGCGIPEEALDRIYDPAFSLKGSRDTAGAYPGDVKGTGYGMANVKRYVELHKGEILIESERDRGTKVTIRLPVIKKELSETEAAEIRNDTFVSGKYILLVEDEQDISNVQYRVLTSAPCRHRVDIAANGRMAVDLFNRNEYDLVSLDYVLPDEISGLDVYRHIRQIDTKIPILFISGNLEFLASVKELKRNDPFIDHVSKPCQNKTYIDSIHQLLDVSAEEFAKFRQQGDGHV